MENYEMNSYGTSRVPQGCTIQEYRKNYASAPLQKSIKTWSIVGYVLCGINLLLAFTVNIFALLDVAILLSLTLGVHLSKSKGCAIGLLVYAIVGGILSLISSGSFTGVLWIAMGAGYLGTISKMDAEYKAEMAKANAPSYDYMY